jgi:hypothetical protein
MTVRTESARYGLVTHVLVKILKWVGHVVKKVREQNYKINSQRKSRRKTAPSGQRRNRWENLINSMDQRTS